MDDNALLREYVARQSEAAFTELAARHMDLVYSTALRVVRETALAQDVTQSVFIYLARKAPTIRSGHALPGWLYRVTRCQAANAVRDARVRRERETVAMNMASADPQSTSVWESIDPHLDQAMKTLTAAEQNAVVLRFFEKRSWREIGSALALNEDAAQKRVSRALDKLRTYFLRRGVVSSAAVVGSVIAANAVQAAPAGLASKVACVSLATAAGAGWCSHLSTCIQAFLMKKTTCAALLVALGVAMTVPIVVSQSSDPPPITEATLRRGLVLHFTFDQPESANRVTDRSGAGNHGQVVGAAWVRDETRSGVFQFSPPGQFIRVPNAESLNPARITLATWIRTANRGDTWRRVFDKGYADGYALSIGGGHTPGNTLQGKAVIEVAMGLNAQSGITGSDQVLTDGQWHQIVTTYNGAEERFYVDGRPQSVAARWKGRVPANRHDLTLGINLVDPNPEFDEVGSSFDGLMDQPMIWNRALSSSEVGALYELQRK